MCHYRISALLCFAIVGATTSAFSGEDWPDFRGPTGQGVSAAKDVPVKWSDQENVAWKTAIPGRGWSSPSLANGRIYLTTAEEGTEQLTLRALCVDAETGRILWNTEVFEHAPESTPPIHDKNSHASPTPIAHGDRLFVHFGHLGTACLDIRGKIIWRNNEIKYPPVHGNGGTPVLVEDVLIFSCDGAEDPFVIALGTSDGAVRWKTPRPCDAAKKFAFSTPLAIRVQSRTQVISPGSHSVNAYEPKSGREIWRVHYDGYSVIPRPVYGHGLIYLSTGYDRPTVMAIRPDGEGDVTETHVAWTIKKGAPHTPSLLLSGNELYMVADNGIASCVDAKTGEPIWDNRIGGNFSASPILAEGRVYLQSEQGVGSVLRAGRDFELLATNPLNQRTLASYAVTDAALFIRGATHLFRIGR